ncbi:expansin EXLX1 family cellulose-binding protein [Nocardia abscessus]|uniref:expansin EXLX1 family cellulose-binding protein n=1 Tax=Nocardia abscessus TaxID=120957 RepID=UPI002458EC75|nr:expansin EXLX1 family cellulose-binding protein [Nocardia abscessus]
MHRVPIQERPFRSEWLWFAAGVLATVAVVVWLVRPSAPSCGAATALNEASSPSRLPVSAMTFAPLGPERSAEARYNRFGKQVSCSFRELPPDGYYAGLSTSDYGRADLCGAYLDIQGPRGPVRALVVDHCPACAGEELNLSAAAFELIADPDDGVAPIRYRLVRDPQPVQELTFEVEQDSSPSWFGILFGGTGNPLREAAVRPAGGGPWQQLTRRADNYWTLSGAGRGPFTARVTDAFGNEAEITGVTVKPGRYSAGVRLYSGAPSFTSLAPSLATSTGPAAAASRCRP